MQNNEIEELRNRIIKLESAVFGHKKSTQKKPKESITYDLDFSLNHRTFVNRYATEKSGPQKFTLLVAYLAKGSPSVEVVLTDVKKLWNKMTAKNLLGSKFNTFYSNQAKTYGWVDSPSHGRYKLTDEWQNAYAEKN